jgi:hypothetical protein
LDRFVQRQNLEEIDQAMNYFYYKHISIFYIDANYLNFASQKMIGHMRFEGPIAVIPEKF